MAESSLSVGYPEMRDRVAHYIGFDRGITTPGDELTTIEEMLDDGYSDFLAGYEWRFLRREELLITEVESADHLSESDFATNTNWTETNDWTFTGGKAQYLFSSNQTSTLTQTSANRTTAGSNVKRYILKYTVAVTTAPDGDFALTITGAFASQSITLPFTAGDQSVQFISSTTASTADFVIQAIATTATKGQFTIDDLDLVKIGDTYDLPDDFGSFRGPITYDHTLGIRPIELVGEGQIRDLRSGTEGKDGFPRFAAFRPKVHDQLDGQRFEVELYPSPDRILTLYFVYNIFVDRIRSATPWPVGGMIHGRTILQAALARSEIHQNDDRGIHAAEFQRLMGESIRYDQVNTPDFMGINSDPSDLDEFHRFGFQGISRDINKVHTVNGIVPT